MGFTLEDLNQRVLSRAGASPDESYTAKLLSEGLEKCAKKFGEESVEAIIAAVSKDKKATISEIADVVYHLLVLLKSSGVTLDEVMASLDRRTAQSGLDEKAARKS
ncbi:MAG: phosphoribosyl-ATP diphosphatase [Devosia sp.]